MDQMTDKPVSLADDRPISNPETLGCVFILGVEDKEWKRMESFFVWAWLWSIFTARLTVVFGF